jgi:hypothetical protein
MAKRSSHTTPGLPTADRHLITRTVFLTSVLLAIVLALMHVLLKGFFVDTPAWLDKVRVGLGLVLFWVFITATIRVLHEFSPKINPLWATLAGIATAGIGMLLFFIFLRILARFYVSEAPLPSYRTIWFYLLGGLLASLISLIRLRIKSRAWSLSLQAILIGVAAAAFFFWMQ